MTESINSWDFDFNCGIKWFRKRQAFWHKIIDDFYLGFFLNESVYFVVEISENSRLLPFTKSTGKMIVLNFPRAGSQISRSFRELEAGIRAWYKLFLDWNFGQIAIGPPLDKLENRFFRFYERKSDSIEGEVAALIKRSVSILDMSRIQVSTAEK